MLIHNRNLSDEEKNKKYQYDRKLYKNFPEDEKQRLVEYRKIYSKIRKKGYQLQRERVTRKNYLIGYLSAQRYETLIGAPIGTPREKYILQNRHRQIIDELRLL